MFLCILARIIEHDAQKVNLLTKAA